MPKSLDFVLTGFGGATPPPWADARVEEQRIGRRIVSLLTALTEINLDILSDYRMPALYESGVRYRTDPPGKELWRDAFQTWKSGEGDCKKLAAWRAAELQLRGVRATPHLVWRTYPWGRKFHVLVSLPNGQFEDPSARLGMKA